jgi:hypothetical protein
MKIKYEISIMEGILRESIKKFPTFNWKTNNDIEFTQDGKVIGGYNMNDTELTASGDIIISYLKTLVKKHEEAEAKKINEEKAKKSVFKNVMEHTNSVNGLTNNPDMFHSISASILETGIDEIRFGDCLNRTNSVTKKVVVWVDSSVSDECQENPESGFYSRLRTLMFDNFKHDCKTTDGIPINTSYFFRGFKTEKVMDIKVKNVLVGKYFTDRNMIQMYINPFSLQKISPVSSEIPDFVTELIKTLKTYKIKAKDTTEFEKTVFIHSFLEKSEEKLVELESHVKDTEKSIKNYEEGIRKNILSYHTTLSEIEYINKNLELKGEGMYEELEEARKLPFVDKLTLGVDSFTIKFKPATFKFDMIKGDSGKSLGKFTSYLGALSIKITPSQFTVSCEDKFSICSGHPHVHGSSSGNPCFGDGPGRNKIYEMLALNKFSELAKLLWFWIKTYRNDGAYVKIWSYVEDRLTKGIPVWNEKGVMLVLNDKELIKSGVQRGMLSKHGYYDTNYDKYKNMKMF